MKYETTVLDIIPRTSDVVSFRFPRIEGLDYKAGQYLFVTIRHEGKELKKHLSFSSSPTEKKYIEFTKKLSNSDFSNALRSAKKGDWASIDAPYGKFTFEGEFERIALLAGGIGITPFISICKNATDKGLRSQISLFYGCKTENDIAFRKELADLAQKNKNLKLFLIVNQPSPQWSGLTGVITADLIRTQLTDYKENIYYVCGPPAMVEAMKKIVKGLGLPDEKLKQEYFTGYT